MSDAQRISVSPAWSRWEARSAVTTWRVEARDTVEVISRLKHSWPPDVPRSSILDSASTWRGDLGQVS